MRGRRVIYSMCAWFFLGKVDRRDHDWVERVTAPCFQRRVEVDLVRASR